MALKQAIEARGLTEKEAWKKSGISIALFDALLGGGVTLPSLALKVGANLGLTMEETKQLGQPLDREKWRRLGLPVPAPLDGDPRWYEKLGREQKRRMPGESPAEHEKPNRRIRRILLDGEAVEKVMKENGISSGELRKRLWPNAGPKSGAQRMYLLRDKMRGGVGVMPDTARKLADALETAVEEIGVEIWLKGGETHGAKKGSRSGDDNDLGRGG